MPTYVVDMRHDGSGEPRFAVAETLEDAAVASHRFFLSYGFELRGGRPWDEGNDDHVDPESGHACFDSVRMHGDKVLEFVHAEGQGPVCYVRTAARAAPGKPAKRARPSRK